MSHAQQYSAVQSSYMPQHPSSNSSQIHRTYIRNEHLSTPPHNNRNNEPYYADEIKQNQNVSMFNYNFDNVQLGRRKASDISVSYNDQRVGYQTPRGPNQPLITVQQRVQFMPNPQVVTSVPFGQVQQSQYVSNQSIISLYQQKKSQYLSRIKNLPDHIQISYPDKGKYIGQVLSKSQPSKSSKQSPIRPQATVRHGQGIFFYPTGDTYFGGWKDEMFHGQGVYMFATGEVYDGLLKNSLKDGTGTYYYDNVTAYYSGNWINDLKHGSGVLNSPQQYYQGQWKQGIKHGNGYYKNKINNHVYVGQFNEGIKQGKGRIVYNDGSVYNGQFRNQLPWGVGNFQYINKDKYIGQFNEGKKHGKGNYFFSEGTLFTGGWKDDHKIQGQLILFNGDVFKGNFMNNQRYSGTYRYKNGDYYQGTWKDDVKHGTGKLILQNGQKYQGNFVQGQKHGQGVYFWQNGDRYQGQFAKDKRQGLGEYYWNQGGKYKGQWKGDRMNGLGRLIKDGIDVIGEFMGDHFQRPVEQGELGNLMGYVLG